MIITGSSDFNRRLLLAVQLDNSLDLRTILSEYELSLCSLLPYLTTKATHGS